MYLQQNDYNSSLNAFNSALSKWQKLNDQRGQAITLKAIGANLSDSNDKQKALEFYLQAEKLFPNNIDYTEKAVLYNGIGSIYEYYQDWKQSILFREKALELVEKDNYAYGQLATLTALGRLHFLMGNRDLALKYFANSENKAIEIKNSYYLAITKEQVGRIYFEQGNYPKAEIFFQKSLGLLQKNQFNARQISRVLNNLGQLYFQKTQYAIAKKYYLSSIKFNQKVRNKFAQAETVFHLAQLNALENNDENALQLAKESIQITESLSSDVLNSKLKSTYFSNVFDRYELCINLLMKMHRQFPEQDFDIQALQATEKSRARSMMEKLSLSEANFNKDANPETVRREKEIRNLLNAKADKLTDVLSSSADKAEIQKLSDEIGELENGLEQIKANLKQNSPIYSAIKNPSPFDTAEFQNRVLDDKTLLLEFSFGKDESFLWLVGENFTESYVLPPREQIESRIEKLRKLIDSREMLEGEPIANYQARITAAESEFEREAQIFSNELLGQIADKIGDKRLIIVPDGKLYYFPIAALPRPNSNGNQPILLTNEIVYEPSASTLALLTRTDRQTSAAPKNLLIFSDPIFSNRDVRITLTAGDDTQAETGSLQTEKFRFAESLTSLARLNASKEEADSIVRIIGASASTALTGAAATRERALDTSIADYKIIHFATHGLINEERPELSGIVLSQVDEAGQNRNGIVRLQDIYAMNLTAEAVVLSACNTGIGKEVKGEGLMSLNNAFLQTGAKSVISSLWKVDDYATQELMKNFYRELASGTVTTSEALRRAQIEIRRNPQYQSPFYWAAFTMQGNYKTAPQLSGDFGYWIYSLLILPFLLLGIYAYRRKSKLLNRKVINKN